MPHTQHQGLLPYFPQKYRTIKPAQQEALEIIEKTRGNVTLELPTGSGKTAIGATFLEQLSDTGQGPNVYVVRSKVLVEQVSQLHPEFKVVLGRNEHPCLYYEDANLKADDIPCAMLTDCPHRVDQETGETEEYGATPCPYLLQKYQARQPGEKVVTTMAFYLFTQLFGKQWGERPAGLVIDEAHQLAGVVRQCLSYEITDWHLERAAELLEQVGSPQAPQLKGFLDEMVKIIKRKKPSAPALLEEWEIESLRDLLEDIDKSAITKSIGEAVKAGLIDPKVEMETLKRLQVLVRDLGRYFRSLDFSLPAGKRGPLNYTYAYWVKERGDNDRVKYRLFIKCYYVAPLIKRILGKKTLAMSATIGDPEIFAHETGIGHPCYSLDSDFSHLKTRVFLPTDTPNLAVNNRNKRDVTQTIRKMARASKRFADQGIRSLVVVISNEERDKFLMMAAEEGVEALSYGKGVKAKEAAQRFKAGEGDVLVGTLANYGEGLDLPKQIAPVIFVLRPSYPPPNDPCSVFEERRFGSMRWRLWNWRVMIEALQVRGRNIRSTKDVGVCIFMSQQFRRFLLPSLPEWLKPAYQGESSFEECLEETLKLLK